MGLPISDLQQMFFFLRLAARDEGVSLRELAEYGITDTKKVKRYMEILSEVEMPEAAPGEYIEFLIEGDRFIAVTSLRIVKPMALSRRDLMAVTLALEWGETCGFVDEMISRNLREKLGGSREPEEAEEVEGLRILFMDEFPGREWISPLARAVEKCRVIEMDYFSRHQGTTSRRRVNPYRLYFRSGVWYLRAWQVNQRGSGKGWRSFRLDRVRTISETGETFDRESLPELESGDTLFVFPENLKTATRTRFWPPSAMYVREMSPPDEVEECDDGDLIVRYEVVGFPYYRSYVLQFGPDAEALEPKEYRDALKDHLVNLKDHLDRNRPCQDTGSSL